MRDYKKIYYFIVFCLTILGSIGGTASLFYFRQYLFGFTNILLVVLAFPEIKRIFLKLTE